MNSLDRPTGAPPVHPIAEHRADAELGVTYDDIKRTLGVPWVGVVLQALAYYRPFFDRAYSQIRPTLMSQHFERICTELRHLAWQDMSDRFSVADQSTALRDTADYSESELDEIRQLLDTFNYGNPKYFLLTTAVNEALLREDSIGGVRPADPADLLPRPPVQASSAIPTMLEEHHVGSDLRELYDDMKSTLGLPFVNSDYKAMARWPTYLERAWQELKPALDTEPYHEVRQKLNGRCVLAARELPYPYRLGRSDLRALRMTDSEIDELIEVVRLFQGLLPGLILNVTHFAIAMNGGSSAVSSDRSRSGRAAASHTEAPG